MRWNHLLDLHFTELLRTYAVLGSLSSLLAGRAVHAIKWQAVAGYVPSLACSPLAGRSLSVDIYGVYLLEERCPPRAADTQHQRAADKQGWSLCSFSAEL